MNSYEILRKTAWLVLASVIASCGSSSGGGIGGTGFVAGVIDGFGSVFVDGIEFDTSAATITIDGTPAAESELRVGMVVGVEGSVYRDGLSGTADTLAAESLVVGTLDAIAADATGIDVLGDRIALDSDTVLDGITLSPDDLGTFIRVSGFLDADDGILATRIARDDRGTPQYVISGVVRDLDEIAETFRIRRITIDYSSAQIDSVPADGPRNGLIARAASATRPSTGVATAESVEFREERLPAAGDAPVRASGIITERPDARTFVLSGRIPVRIVDKTEIVGGTAVDLRANTLVTISGRTDRRRAVIARIVVIRKVDAAAASALPAD